MCVPSTWLLLSDLDALFIVVLDKYHWMLYFLVTAMYPRSLITLDEELNNIPVTVRVGQVSIHICSTVPYSWSLTVLCRLST